MKILIIVGFELPQASELLGRNRIPFGGWVTGLINGLKLIEDVEIGVAMKSTLAKYKRISDKKGIIYYFLPFSKKDILDVNIQDAKTVINDFKPDIVHAEGAEVSITNTFFSLTNAKKVLSIKGIFNSIQKYEFGGLDIFKLIFSMNIKNIIFGFSLIYQKYFRYKLRKLKEVDSYRKADYILGRTLYDESYSYTFNSNVGYRLLNESLRDSFYGKKWNINSIERNSVFVGNGYIARKGLHTALDSIAVLKDKFPSIKLYVIREQKISLKERYTYKGYIDKKIKKLNLLNHVIFLDPLSEKEMLLNMLNKHIHILPSFIENSSNTLGEAMLIGLPSIVAYSGGVSSVAKDEDEVLFYRSSDSTVLAYQIKRVFESDELALRLHQNSIERAEYQYSRSKNSSDLLEIYKEIIKNSR